METDTITTTEIKVGIIGGSGLNDPDILQDATESFVETLFGSPSDALITGKIGDVPCVVLARHGRDHSIIPSDVNYRANIWALKEAGCTHVLATTACGGLQDYTQPGDIVILDQFLDFSKGREQTLYGGTQPSLAGVLHIPMGDPFCEKTRQVLIKAASEISLTVWNRTTGAPDAYSHPCVHTHGSAVTINGPRFSTRFESLMFRGMGIDLINMTLVPEVVLAREAGMSYAAVAIITDYDCWKTDSEPLSVSNILKEFKQNVSSVKSLLVRAVKLIGQRDWSGTIKANELLVSQNRQDLLHNGV